MRLPAVLLAHAHRDYLTVAKGSAQPTRADLESERRT
jgi:hypothetical protein